MNQNGHIALFVGPRNKIDKRLVAAVYNDQEFPDTFNTDSAAERQRFAASLRERFDLESWAVADVSERLIQLSDAEDARAESAAKSKPIARFKPFPVNVLPEPVRSFVAAGAESIVCDPSLVALPLLCGLAGAVGATRRLRTKRDWHEPCVLWGAVVSVSGSQKSPAQYAAVRHLEEAQAHHIEHEAARRDAYELDKRFHEDAIKAWMKSKAKGNTDPPPEKPDEPTTVRYIVDNTTIESLATRLDENPRGLLVATDELSAWLGSMGRYSSGKSQGEKGQWLSMYRAGRLLVDRKTGDKKTIHVRHAAVSIAGGVPPNTLRKLIAGEDMSNGLAARLLIAMPPRRPKRWSDAEIPESVDKRIQRLFGRLLALDFDLDAREVIRPVDILLDDDATALAARFVNEHGDEQTSLDEHVASVWSKLEAVAFRLALLFALVRWADGEDAPTSHPPVTANDLAAAIQLVKWFGNEWRRFHATFGESEADSERRRLVEWIEQRGGSVTVRDVLTGNRRFGTADEVETEISELIKAGLGDWGEVRTTAKGGRPKRAFTLQSVSASAEPPESRASSGFADADSADDPKNTHSDNLDYEEI